MTKHEIFPTPVWHIEGAPQQLIEELYEGAYKFKEKYESETKSNKGGYQTPILEWEMFHPEGKKYINNVVGDIFKFNVEGWWYNINGQGDWNSPHTHPNVNMALVLYVTDSDGLLTFMNTHPMRLIDDQAYGGAGDYAAMKANKGDIIMFPSDLVHYVLPNPRKEDRISISMNISIR